MAPTPPHSTPAATKRKRGPPSQESSRKRSRPSFHDARAISSQTTGRAFGNGEIDVDKFVKAREFEIKALEQGMKNAKNVLMKRAFQSVPRELRRRTASHNVKKVPKRLRPRAAREMAEDNTPTVTSRRRKLKPKLRLRVDVARRLKELNARKKLGKDAQRPEDTGNKMGNEASGEAANPKGIAANAVVPREPRIKKNTLQKPDRPKAKFRKRQIHKAWLPTHLFHTKRAHMTPPKEPLWRMAIPLSPTVKSYRPTHRATTLRGAMAWDMSYMSTIELTGLENSVIGLFKALGVGRDEAEGFWEKRASRWIRGSRYWHGWLYERDGWPIKSIAPVMILWCADDEPLAEKMDVDVAGKKQKLPKRQAFIRVHPSAFLELWEELLRVSKVQKPAVQLEDLRFEIGSIEVSGPASTEALSGVLWPSTSVNAKPDDDNKSTEHIWRVLRNVATPANLPINALLSLNVTDPRLHQGVKVATTPQSLDSQTELLQTLATWPPDKSRFPAALFSRTARLAASRQLPSQKAINRRKSLAEPGQLASAAPTDPNIPILLLASRSPGGGSGGWTLLLPWKCVLPVWYCLMYYPLSTGGTVRFGGLDQLRQTAFEAGVPWFPADHQGTKAGKAWEACEREKRKAAWKRKPKGRRVEFETLKLSEDRTGEVGLGWACDWEKLVSQKLIPESVPQAIHRIPEAVARRRLKEARTLRQDTVDNGTTSSSASGLVTVRVTLTGRGVPTPCARIYRLPVDNKDLREQWLALLTRPRDKEAQVYKSRPPRDAPAHLRRQHLAASLLEPAVERAGEGSDVAEVPGEEDLMGFITTGNFNLHEGKGTGLGCILLQKALEYQRWKIQHLADATPADEQICIVKEAGQALGRLGRWELA